MRFSYEKRIAHGLFFIFNSVCTFRGTRLTTPLTVLYTYIITYATMHMSRKINKDFLWKAAIRLFWCTE